MKTQMTKTEFKRKYARPMGATSLTYLKNGLFRDVFKKAREQNHKKGKTVWGYEIVPEITITVAKARIKYMEAQIKKEVWSDRALVFAKHHLLMLKRRLVELQEERMAA